MKIISLFVAAMLFLGVPSSTLEKAQKLNSYTDKAMQLMEKWSDGRAKSEEVDEVLLKIINMPVPKELHQHKLLILRILFQYEFALELKSTDPYTSETLLKYLAAKLIIYKMLLDAYLQGAQSR